MIRPHRTYHTTYVDAAYCYQSSSVVRRSVTLVSPAKTVEAIEMSFRQRTHVDPRNHVLDGGPHPACEAAILRREGASHCEVRGHSAVICARTAEPVEMLGLAQAVPKRLN